MIMFMSAKRQPIREKDLQGFKYFRMILPLLERLHEAGTTRDKAGNRILHFDEYIALQLLFFFNPAITSMRAIVAASHLGKVQKTLGTSSTSLGSFSEAGSVFDAELLKPIIAELGLQLKPMAHDTRLDQLPGQLMAVDGTELSALGRLAERAWQDGDIKLHTHFQTLTGVPLDMDLTERDASETQHLREHLTSGKIYTIDRGYACFGLFQEVLDAGSNFVGRLRDTTVYEVLEDRPLTPEAKAAGVLSDQIVLLGSPSTKGNALRQRVRVVKVACKPHRKRTHTARGGPEQGEWLLIATSLLDVPAEAIALIYRKRWAVELFFRFFKHVLRCKHLLSYRANGIQIQAYVAIIVCMLIALWTGRKPNKRTYEMIQLYFMGWASEDELEAHLLKLPVTPV
jgi:hypothetical protein